LADKKKSRRKSVAKTTVFACKAQKGKVDNVYTRSIIITMHFDFSSEKNALLVKTRNVSFEMVIDAIKNDGKIWMVKSPNTAKHPNQDMLLAELNGYIYAIPYVITGDCCFLKTIYASRKFTKLFLGKDD